MIERVPGETDKAWQAFQDFFAMGQGRSIKLLHRQYSEQNRKKRNVTPTKSYKTIAGWSSVYKWDERVKAADKEIEAERLQAIKDEQKREQIERLKAFRGAADQSAILSVATSAKTLKGMQAIAEQVLNQINLDAQTSLKDLALVAQVLQLLTRNTQEGFNLKAQIEGLESIIQELDKD